MTQFQWEPRQQGC